MQVMLSNLVPSYALIRFQLYKSVHFHASTSVYKKSVITLALCNVVLVISIFVIPLIFPKGSSSLVNNRILFSAVFADLT